MKNLFGRDPDPFSARRYSDIVRSVRVRERRRMHRWQWALLAVAVVLAGLAGFAYWKYKQIEAQLHKDGPNVAAVDAGEPFNLLLVGSDSRGDLTEREQERLGANAVEGERADTLVLAHIDPASNKVFMVQFPRDLYVPIAGDGKDKINSALLEGTQTLVNTVQQLTGLEVNKYVEINIAGFRDVVDAIDGVDICVTEPIPFDPHTGIKIPEDELGMVHFDGDRALRFVRSRNFESGDFERIRNQQKFLAAAVGKVTSTGTLLRPDRVLELIDIAGDNLRTDVETSLAGLRELIARFRNFDPQRYEAYTVPNRGIANIDGASVVVPDYRSMKVLFEALENNRSPAEADGVPDVDPSSIRVAVYNGVGLERSVAAPVADALRDATDPPSRSDDGVQIVEVGNARSFGVNRTRIRYEDAGARPKAELVAAAVPGAELERGRTAAGVDVAVIVGRKGSKVRPIVQIRPISIPPPAETPAACREAANA